MYFPIHLALKFRTLLFKVWVRDLDHGHHLGPDEKCRCSGASPDPLHISLARVRWCALRVCEEPCSVLFPVPLVSNLRVGQQGPGPIWWLWKRSKWERHAFPFSKPLEKLYSCPSDGLEELPSPWDCVLWHQAFPRSRDHSGLLRCRLMQHTGALGKFCYIF